MVRIKKNRVIFEGSFPNNAVKELHANLIAFVVNGKHPHVEIDLFGVDSCEYLFLQLLHHLHCLLQKVDVTLTVLGLSPAVIKAMRSHGAYLQASCQYDGNHRCFLHDLAYCKK